MPLRLVFRRVLPALKYGLGLFDSLQVRELLAASVHKVRSCYYRSFQRSGAGSKDPSAAAGHLFLRRTAGFAVDVEHHAWHKRSAEYAGKARAEPKIP